MYFNSHVLYHIWVLLLFTLITSFYILISFIYIMSYSFFDFVLLIILMWRINISHVKLIFCDIDELSITWCWFFLDVMWLSSKHYFLLIYWNFPFEVSNLNSLFTCSLKCLKSKKRNLFLTLLSILYMYITWKHNEFKA